MTDQASDQYGRLPAELKAARQWCIAGPDKAPYVATATGISHASVLRPQQWKDFYSVEHDRVATGAPNIGFMLTYEDPWTCIDLDVKGPHNEPDTTKWTSQKDIDRYMNIVRVMDSYTEVSASGYGLHIWVRGRIGTGVRRDGVEVYSQERFIVCTGNVYVDKPIADRQEILDNMVMQMRGEGYSGPIPLVELPEDYSDMEIFDMACNASNKEKFNSLCAGNWKDEYPSQSEADLALMSMFTFYSKSNEQCRRMFRCTALGQREKATKNDRYLNYTLEVIRHRQQKQSIIDETGRLAAENLVRSLQSTDYADVAAAKVASKVVQKAEIQGSISWPPGLAGAIAGYIYNSAPRPVKEVAIVAAIGFLAGVAGKAFNIPQSGLNVYMILVAKSGVGKEAMHSGLSLICNELRSTLPAAQKFVDFNDFASGPALVKACAAQSSFVNVAGEWGRKLKRLSEERNDTIMAGIRTAMTNLYQKSSGEAMSGGITYSNKEQNIASLTGVAYSMIGETTPGTFYDALTPSMMEDGFLSRFIIVDYNGDRPPLNHNVDKTMPPQLAQALHGLCAQALTINTRFGVEKVTYNPQAAEMLNAFDLECDKKINESNDESQRQMWNRAHLKVCRVASLLAVADNWIEPVVNEVHVNWALELIQRDIHLMSQRIIAGDIGNDDIARERKALSVMKEYLTGKVSNSYKVPEAMRADGIIPKRYLQIRLSQASQFRNTRDGATRSLGNTLTSLIDSGYIIEMDKGKVAEKYMYHGKTYRVVSLPED